MTLKGEITEIIGKAWRLGEADEIIVCRDYADEILKLFEKVIDEKIKEYATEAFAEVDEVIAGFEDLKEELTK